MPDPTTHADKMGKVVSSLEWDESELAWVLTLEEPDEPSNRVPVIDLDAPPVQEHIRFISEQRSKVEDKFAELCELGHEVNKLVDEVERLERAAAGAIPSHLSGTAPNPNEDEPSAELHAVYSLRLRIEGVADALLRLASEG